MFFKNSNRFLLKDIQKGFNVFQRGFSLNFKNFN